MQTTTWYLSDSRVVEHERDEVRAWLVRRQRWERRLRELEGPPRFPSAA